MFGSKKKNEMWAVTCHFNPVGYKIKLDNFRVFRKHLGIKLMTVELSLNGKYEIQEADTDMLVRVSARADSILWHKENLLNIGVSKLPDQCDKVVIVDADVIFTDPTWPEKVHKMLDDSVVVQLFDRVWRLKMGEEIWTTIARTRGLTVEDATPGGEYGKFEIGWVASVERNDRHIMHERWPGAPGFAWAYPRWLLDQYKLFDRMIVGSADTLMACAVYGQIDNGYMDGTYGYGFTNAIQRVQDGMSYGLKSEYVQWAKEFNSVTEDGVAHYPQAIYHLWHGDREDRQYAERNNILQGFYPNTHLIYNPQGVLEWRQDASTLRTKLLNYFLGRKEDRPADHIQLEFEIPALKSKRRRAWLERKGTTMKTKQLIQGETRYLPPRVIPSDTLQATSVSPDYIKYTSNNPCGTGGMSLKEWNALPFTAPAPRPKLMHDWKGRQVILRKGLTTGGNHFPAGTRLTVCGHYRGKLYLTDPVLGRISGVDRDCVELVSFQEQLGRFARVKQGYVGAGRQCRVMSAPFMSGQLWVAVQWDGEEDPDVFKYAGLEPIR